jgi:hypothetical protein
MIVLRDAMLEVYQAPNGSRCPPQDRILTSRQPAATEESHRDNRT